MEQVELPTVPPGTAERLNGKRNKTPPPDAGNKLPNRAFWLSRDLMNGTAPVCRWSDRLCCGACTNWTELGRSMTLEPASTLRPFFGEASGGVEKQVRAGVDLTFGQSGQVELLVRNGVGNHCWRAVQADWTGFTFVLWGNIAGVTDSEFLPSALGIGLEQTCGRVRAGVM